MMNIRIKMGKSASWKPLKSDMPVLQGEFSNFLGIDELTDYQIVSHISDKKNSNKRKRQESNSGVDTESDELGAVPNAPPSKTKKKRSKKKKKIKQRQDDKHEDDQKKEKEPAVVVNKPKKIKTPKKTISYNKLDKWEVTEMTADKKTTADLDMSLWSTLFVPDEVLKALKDQSFTCPTSIQMLTLPSAIRDRMDILGAAETGSGKTLAFGIPIIHSILRDKEEEENEEGNKIIETEEEMIIMDEAHESGNSEEEESDEDEVQDGPGCVKVIDDIEFGADFQDEEQPMASSKYPKSPLRALIITPTRELAIQITRHLMQATKYTDIKIAVVVGGMAVEKQKRLLRKNPDIVIGTPGRLWELVQTDPHLARIPDIKYLVIDEADRMLEKGHFAELSQLLEYINRDEEKNRQTFVFSATLTLVHDTPMRINLKGKKKFKVTTETKLESFIDMIGLKKDAKVIDITRKLGTAEGLKEARICCKVEEKDFYLYYFLVNFPGRTLVFCNSIDCVRRLKSLFTHLKQNPWTLHASMNQRQRLKNLERFKTWEKGMLLATDVAARGLDIPNVEHVIHYQVPRTSEVYVHRSGRTARAAKEGLSIMLIQPDELNYYKKVCKTLNRDDDLPVFPVDGKMLTQIKERVSLASQLDKLEYRMRRNTTKNNWFIKAAKDMDIELDDDELSNNMEGEDKSIYQKQMKALQKSLNSLLATNINRHTGLSPYLIPFQAFSTTKTKAIDVIKKEISQEQQVQNKKNRRKKKRHKPEKQ